VPPAAAGLNRRRRRPARPSSVELGSDRVRVRPPSAHLRGDGYPPRSATAARAAARSRAELDLSLHVEPFPAAPPPGALQKQRARFDRRGVRGERGGLADLASAAPRTPTPSQQARARQTASSGRALPDALPPSERELDEAGGPPGGALRRASCSRSPRRASVALEVALEPPARPRTGCAWRRTFDTEALRRLLPFAASEPPSPTAAASTARGPAPRRLGPLRRRQLQQRRARPFGAGKSYSRSSSARYLYRGVQSLGRPQDEYARLCSAVRGATSPSAATPRSR